MIGYKHFFSPLIINSKRLRIRGVGVHEPMLPGRVLRPQGTGDYLFMLFHDPVTLVADKSRHAAPANTLVLWPPDSGHDYGSSSSPWNHSWIHCDGSAVSRFLRQSALPLDRLLAPPKPERIVRHLETLYAQIVDPRPDPRIVENLLQNMLLDLARSLEPLPVSNTPIPPAFLLLRQKLERSPQDRVRLAQLARSVNLSPPHFSSQWRRHFHVSPIEDVIRMRIDQAKYLLLDHNRRIADVARSVGVDDPYRFSKLFRKRVGLSPRAYRAQCAG